MRRLKDLSLATRIFANVALLILVIVAVQVVFFTTKQSKQFVEALREKAVSESMIIAHMASAGFDFDNRADVEAVFEGARKDRDLVYAAMFRKDGTIMASKGAPLIQTAPVYSARIQTAETNDTLTVTVPVKTKNRKTGTLVASFSKSSTHDKSRSTLKAMLIAAAIVMAIAFLATYTLGRGLRRRLKGIARMAEHVAKGDLAVSQFEERSGDEVGQMAAALNTMIDNLRKLRDQAGRIAQGDLSTYVDVPGDLADAFNAMTESQRKMVLNLTNTATVLAGAAQSLLTTSEGMSREAEAMQQQSVHVDGAAQEMSSTIQELATSADSSAKGSSGVADSTKTMSNHITTIAASIEQMSGGLQEVSRNCNQAAVRTGRSNEKAKEATMKVQELGKAAKMVGQIVDVISQVADQTKLLALNATIEAASAGEAGRGFAVVANEVKELAKQTTHATGDIVEHVDTIKGVTTNTVDVIRNMSELIDEISHAFNVIAVSIEQQSGVVQEISSNISDGAQAAIKTSSGVDEISTRMGDIAAFAARLAQRSNEVTKSISRVKQAADSTATGTEHVRNAAAEMSELAGQLTEAVSQFTLQKSGSVRV